MKIKKADISTLQNSGHFYLALTGIFTSTMLKVKKPDELKQREDIII